MNRPVPAPPAVEYPCSDGQPMAETEFQLIPLINAISALRSHFAGREDVYVVGNMFLYYQEGNPRAVVAPDLFVVVGAPKHKRHTYKLWEEPKAPDFVLEVTSRSTRKVDQGRKREVYASLDVGEYWQFDPTGDYLAPRLQGLQLHRGDYRPLPSVATVDGGLLLHSPTLGLDVRLERGEELRFHDPATCQDLLSYEETLTQMREARTQTREAQAQTREAQAQKSEAQAQKSEAQAQKSEAQARMREVQARMREERAAHQATRARLEELEARLRRSG
ncbi:MAG: Uma2 family endonuclease [Thiotrichales bacterium]|nr:Uma2 family endonuclease [Thiotrichales bacterium]